MPSTPDFLQGKPPSGLGGHAVDQIEGQLKSLAVMPSPDIMVSRTTGGTFLNLRGAVATGGGAQVVEVEIDETRSTPLSGTTGIVTGTVGRMTTADWNSGAAYGLGDKVLFAQNLYRANATTVAGESPATTPSKWDIQKSAQVKVLLAQYLHTGYKPDPSALIKPDYKKGDIIYCVAISKGSDDETYLDLNLDARRWSVQIQFCQNGVSVSYWLSVIN